MITGCGKQRGGCLVGVRRCRVTAISTTFFVGIAWLQERTTWATSPFLFPQIPRGEYSKCFWENMFVTCSLYMLYASASWWRTLVESDATFSPASKARWRSQVLNIQGGVCWKCNLSFVDSLVMSHASAFLKNLAKTLILRRDRSVLLRVLSHEVKSAPMHLSPLAPNASHLTWGAHTVRSFWGRAWRSDLRYLITNITILLGRSIRKILTTSGSIVYVSTDTF